jgi:hypothetical protein
MASLISNIIVPSTFSPYVLEQSVTKNGLIRSGIVTQNPVMSAYLAAAGDGANLLTFKNLDLNGTSANVGNADPAAKATAETISAHKQKFMKLARNKVYVTADLEAALLAQDPAQAIAASVADAVIQWRQASLLKLMAGCVNTTVASGLVNAVAVEATGSYATATRINAGTIGTTLVGAWGDYGVRDQMTDNVMGTAVFMHPDTYAFLTSTDYTSFQRGSVQTFGFTTYLGMPVIVDSTLPKVAGSTSGYKYTTYFVKAGAINFGYAQPKLATEVWRDILAGNGQGAEYLAQRDIFGFHITGFSFTGSAAGDNVTDTELGTAANFTQILANKQIGVAALIHNAA